MAAYKVVHKVHFEYADYVDKEEQVFKNVYSMASLSKCLKGKTYGVKGISNNNPKPNEGEEESARRLAAGEKKLLVEEAQRDKAEAAKQKNT